MNHLIADLLTPSPSCCHRESRFAAVASQGAAVAAGGPARILY
jgi:hypothetical protein